MLLALFSRLFVRRASAFVAAFALAATTALAQSPRAADGFDPDVDGNVFVLVTQPDGKLLIGGLFSAVGGAPRKNLARLNADGSLDAGFNPNPDGAVRAIVLQPDNRVVIGGDFKAVGATTRNRVARLTADGALDAAFNPNIGGELFPQVYALLLQPDGRIVVGGSFSTVQPGPAGAITPRNNLARFNADGTLEAAFNPNPNGMVLALGLHVDGKIIVGGGFTTLQPPSDSSPSTRNRIARLNVNGTVDTQFDPNANNGVTTIAIQRDGKILLGGYFTTLQPSGEELTANRAHFARLNANGSLDSEFISRVEGDVAAIAIQPDGSILVGGAFSAVWGRGSTSAPRNNVARFGPDGSLDANFSPTLNSAVDAFAIQPDGRVVIGGHFTRAQRPGGSTVIRNHLARLTAEGALDANFELDAGGRILVSVTQADGKTVIGGTFTSVGGATHNYLARLNADGSIDPSYAPDLNGRVYTLAYEAGSGKVIVGGEFTTIGGEPRNHIARLNASGSIDSEFNPNIDGQVGTILLLADGRMLVGGSFANVQPLGAAEATRRSNLLRLNANGTLDTAFDPSPNSSVSALAVQSDGKVILGGLFSALTPGVATNTSAGTTARNFLARVNSDGTLDTTFNPRPNAQVTSVVIQSDGKIIVGGGFTQLLPEGTTAATERNHIVRLNADGSIDTAYNPNANGSVLAMALQADGKLLIGGSFTTVQPNADTVYTLRKYAARLNADGSVEPTFNLDINELNGNRVDSIRIQSDGRVLLGGSFVSLQPAGTAARLTRRNFVRLTATTTVDTSFDPGIGGSTGAIMNGLAVQPDGKVIAVGNFGDLGGARSTNIARFRAEGTPDPEFSNSLTADGPINAVVVRPNGAPVPSQAAGFAWLNANGTLRAAFATGTARLSGEASAIAVLANGQVLVGGSFTNLDNSTGGNLVRFNANGQLDTSFSPTPNGAVTGIVIQPDGRIVVVGSFTLIGGEIRNRIARLDTNGALDVTYDPNANGKINAVMMESDGRLLVGGAFTSFTPNFTNTAVARNYLARVNADGSIDAAYNPNPNFNVNALALQGDGKLIAGGSFSSVQPNAGTEAYPRNGIARFNADGTVDQNFNPNANASVNALVALSNGQLIVGGTFTALQPNGAVAGVTRNNLARVNSDGAVDLAFNPNANGAVTSLAAQTDGSVLVGGTFTTLQPAGTAAAVSRNHLARLLSDGSLDLNFNPDVNGSVATVVGRPDGTVLVGGNFSSLQLNGSIYVGGNFANIGGVPARNLASLNENGSVNSTFQPRPDGAVNALLVLPDGRAIAGGVFTNIGGAARNRIARFTAQGALDPAFNPNAGGSINAIAAQPDGKIFVGGAFTTIGGQTRTNLARLNADGTVDAAFTAPASTGAVTGIAVVPGNNRILVLMAGSGTRNVLIRLNADGTPDASFPAVNGGSEVISAFTLQADGRIVVAGAFTAIGGANISRLARLEANGGVDSSFNPAPNGVVTALAIQPDGRIVVGGGFNSVGGVQRVGIARLGAAGLATQLLSVAANRSSVTWNRTGVIGEVSSVTFELSSDRVTWTRLGEGTRVAGSPNWQLGGLNLPASGLFYIRARGIAPTSSGTSSGLFESVREFTFSSPLPQPVGPATTTPQIGASPAFDPYTGITARSTISVVPGEGSVEIFVSSLVAPVANPRPARLANLSTRGRVAADSPLILGFAIVGNEPRRVLLRAVGPGLSGFGVGGALPATRLQVYDAAGSLLVTNEGWANSTEVTQTGASSGAFPLASGSADSAAVLSLAPGNYTIQVVDARGNGGVALAEIYDAGTGAASRLVNVSSRGAAGAGANALISGFVVAGDASQRVLLRGVGPGLAKFGTPGVADPAIALFDGAGRELGSNDNWVSSVGTVSAATAGAGAFALDPGSKDAAVLATLPSGAYTIQVTGDSNGPALLEVYEVR